MKTSRSAFLRCVFGVLMVTMLLLVPASGASANVRTIVTEIPYYARLVRGEFYHEGEWAAIVFYHPTACVPSDFNLLDRFDGRAIGQPPSTAGFAIWDDPSPGPRQVELHGLGAVPVWFVNWPALQAAVADDLLTIGELSSLEHLIGSASFYQETLHAAEVDTAFVEMNAHGTLEDGRTFTFHAINHYNLSISTSITFR